MNTLSWKLPFSLHAVALHSCNPVTGWSHWGCAEQDCRYSIKGIVQHGKLTTGQMSLFLLQTTKSQEFVLCPRAANKEWLPSKNKLYCYLSAVRQCAELMSGHTCCGGAAHHKCWTCVGLRWRCDQMLTHRCSIGRSRLVVHQHEASRSLVATLHTLSAVVNKIHIMPDTSARNTQSKWQDATAVSNGLVP